MDNYDGIEIEDLACCGTCEINGIKDNTPQYVIGAMHQYLFFTNGKEVSWRNRRVFAYFTDNRDKKFGNALEKYIKKESLGAIIKTQTRINPNSKNPLKVWVWTLNHDNIKKWYLKNKGKYDDNAINENAN